MNKKHLMFGLAGLVALHFVPKYGSPQENAEEVAKITGLDHNVKVLDHSRLPDSEFEKNVDRYVAFGVDPQGRRVDAVVLCYDYKEIERICHTNSSYLK